MAKKRRSKLAPEQGAGSTRIAPPTFKNDVPAEQQPPVFSLEYLQQDYCVTACQIEDQAKFALRLRKLGQLTWSQIQSASRHGLGYEKINRGAIRASIPRHITEDVSFIAFRFSALKPMVGYRSGRVFYVIWLDKDFTLYDHGS
ncbi:MAG: hypothetical protein AAF282_11210 [Cyanobacteria bacterium P01_A01_bin.15]